MNADKRRCVIILEFFVNQSFLSLLIMRMLKRKLLNIAKIHTFILLSCILQEKYGLKKGHPRLGGGDEYLRVSHFGGGKW